MVRRLAALLLAAALCEARFTAPALAVRSAGARTPLLSGLAVRGGGSDEAVDEKKPNAVSELLGQLPPCTRAHVVGVAVCTAVALSGVVDPDQMLSLDPVRTIFKLQLWRPLSAATFLGKPSMASATSVYLLIKYGRELEAAVGTAAFSKFLALQMVLLTLGGSAFSIPFTANALITSIIYACSRLEPFGDIQFQFGIKLKYWMLPYGLMAVEVLQQQSIAAVVPHVLGVCCSHVHHFFSVVWPRMNEQAAQSGATLRPRGKASPLAPKRGRKLSD